MDNDQKTRYELMLQTAKEELNHLDEQLGEEVTRARQRIEELQKTKKVVKQIHDGVCALLGVKSVVVMKEYGLGILKGMPEN